MKLTKEQIERREAEMKRGAEVLIEKHGADILRQTLSRAFNPDHVDNPGDPNGARPSPGNKEYRERMQRQVRDR